MWIYAIADDKENTVDSLWNAIMQLTTESTPQGAVLVLHHSVSRHNRLLRVPGHRPSAFATLFSLFYVLDNQKVIAKLIKPKSFPKDYLRRYLLDSEAARVFWSTVQLNTIGIAAPEPLGFSVMLNPFARYESIYYAEYKADTITLKTRLPYLSETDRRHLLANIARDYAHMINQYFNLKDLHFENILVGHQDEHWWIDTDLRRIRPLQRLLAEIRRELSRLKRRTTDVLSPKEWDYFNAQVAQNTHVIRIPHICDQP